MKKINESARQPGPVAVGGIGGSGTRLVAEILIRLGFYMGSDLNHANDNQWFTLLFKRPAWFEKHARGKQSEISKGIAIFEKAMTGRLDPGPAELAFIMKAAVPMAMRGHDHLHHGRGYWSFKRMKNLLRSGGGKSARHIGWGWKEPNTHIYLEYLCDYFPSLKYIHVFRHGLDMAYSKNQAQLYNWGRLFGVEMPLSASLIPKASLKYWIEANRKAIMLGTRLLGDRFYQVNMDELCRHPEKGIHSLTGFLNLNPQKVDLELLMSLPRTPPTAQRYKKHDLQCFSLKEIYELQELGFRVESSKN